MRRLPYLITPSVFLQGIADNVNDNSIPSKDRFKDMYIVPDSQQFKTSLKKHEVKKVVLSDSYIAILTGTLQ